MGCVLYEMITFEKLSQRLNKECDNVDELISNFETPFKILLKE